MSVNQTMFGAGAETRVAPGRRALPALASCRALCGPAWWSSTTPAGRAQPPDASFPGSLPGGLEFIGDEPRAELGIIVAQVDDQVRGVRVRPVAIADRLCAAFRRWVEKPSTPKVNRTGKPSAARSRTDGSFIWERVLCEVRGGATQDPFSISRRRFSRPSCMISDLSAVVRPSCHVVVDIGLAHPPPHRFDRHIEISRDLRQGQITRRATVTTSRLNSQGTSSACHILPARQHRAQRVSTRRAAVPTHAFYVANVPVTRVRFSANALVRGPLASPLTGRQASRRPETGLSAPKTGPRGLAGATGQELPRPSCRPRRAPPSRPPSSRQDPRGQVCGAPAARAPGRGAQPGGGRDATHGT